MHRPLSLLVVVVVVASAAVATAGGISQKELVGSWKGQVSIPVGDQTKDIPIELTFHADGTMKGQAFGAGGDGYFEVRGKTTLVLLDENKKTKATITKVKLTKTSLSGQLLPGDSTESKKEIRLSMERVSKDASMTPPYPGYRV